MKNGWHILSFKRMANVGHHFSFISGSQEIFRYLFICKKRIRNEGGRNVLKKCFILQKKVFLKISQISQGNEGVESVFNKVPDFFSSATLFKMDSNLKNICERQTASLILNMVYVFTRTLFFSFPKQILKPFLFKFHSLKLIALKFRQ